MRRCALVAWCGEVRQYAGQVAPPGPHEIRYTLSHSKEPSTTNPYGSFTIRRYDIDAAAYVGSLTIGKPNGATNFDYLETSPDRQRCVVKFSGNHACVVELATMAATWLPLAPSGKTRGRPRFRPGDSERVWFAETYDNWSYGASKDRDTDLVAFDLLPGSATYATETVRLAINDDPGTVGSTNYTSLHPDWSFDPTGGFACFVRMQSWNNGYPVASWFTRYPVGSTAGSDSSVGFYSAPWANAHHGVASGRATSPNASVRSTAPRSSPITAAATRSRWPTDTAC